MKLIVISSSQQSEKEHQVITALFENGLSTLHLRKPEISTKEMRELIGRIPVHFHDRIVIHSHHKLAASMGLKGIHLTRAHRKRRFYTIFRLPLMKLRRPGLTMSTSYTKLSHIYGDEGRYDYVLLSPLFDTIGGGMHSGFTAQALRSAITKNPQVKVIARGGISVDHLAAVCELGFHGVAFHSLIWKSSNPVEQFQRILDKLKELGVSVE